MKDGRQETHPSLCVLSASVHIPCMGTLAEAGILPSVRPVNARPPLPD